MRRLHTALCAALTGTALGLTLCVGWAHLGIIQAISPAAVPAHVGNQPYSIKGDGLFLDTDPTPHSAFDVEAYSSVNGGPWSFHGSGPWPTTWNVYNGCQTCTVYWTVEAWAQYYNPYQLLGAWSGSLGPYYTP